MKKIKTFTALALAVIMAFALCACGSNAKNAAETPDAQKDKFVIGICQVAQHPALDAATLGFKNALIDALGEDKLEFDEQNASGELNNCGTIINGFVSKHVDLILANATAPLQAAASATDTIPILGTSVTDYASALEIEGWTGTVGGNISGTSDCAPLAEQAKMLNEWFPDAKNVGIIFCSAEANSVFQAETVGAALTEMGYTVTQFSFTDSNDIGAVTQTACDNSDVIYIPTDNTAANNAESIANIVLAEKVPVVAGEQGICAACGVCTLSIDYYELGEITGKMAAQILTGQADISTMPVQYAPNVSKMFNPAICDQLGITAPDDYDAIE